MRKGSISAKEAMGAAFYEGMQIGFELGHLGKDIAPKIVGKGEKEVEMILRKRIDSIFRASLKRVGKKK